MRKTNLLLLGLSFLLFSGCNRTSKAPHELTAEEIQEIRQDKMEVTEVHFHKSEKIAGTDFLIYPVSASTDEQGAQYYSKGDYDNRTWNIIFYNVKTQEQHFLFNDIIPTIKAYPSDSDFQYIDPDEVEKIKRENRKEGQLFFEIIMEDFNGDGKMDDSDPNALFVSDLNGSNMQRLSPKGLDLQTWKFIDEEKTKIEFRCREDSDGNKYFDSDDRIKVLLLSLGDPQNELIDLFPNELRQQLKEKYIDQ